MKKGPMLGPLLCWQGFGVGLFLVVILLEVRALKVVSDVVVIIFMAAQAANGLESASRASLDVTARHMKLPFNHPAIPARAIVCSPVLGFISIAHPRVLLSFNGVGGMGLCLFNLSRPIFGHTNTVINHILNFQTYLMVGLLGFSCCDRTTQHAPAIPEHLGAPGISQLKPNLEVSP